MKTVNALTVTAFAALTLSLANSGQLQMLSQTNSPTKISQAGNQSATDAKALNDKAVSSFATAGRSSRSANKDKYAPLLQAEQLLRQSLAAAKSAGDVCLEATAMRNLAAMYETSTYQGYVEETAGIAKSTTELKKKTESVNTAWTDPRFLKCKQSSAKRISLYGPALDDSEIDSFENFYQELRAAVKRGDKNATAALFDFPMQIRGKKKRTIRTKAEFLRSYDSIITPGVAKALASTSPAQLWGRDQGICVGSGILWLNSNMQKPNRFLITSVND